MATPRYAISGLNGSPLTDGKAIARRGIDDAATLGPNEVEWDGNMPPMPGWDASTSNVISMPSQYDSNGEPLTPSSAATQQEITELQQAAAAVANGQTASPAAIALALEIAAEVKQSGA